MARNDDMIDDGGGAVRPAALKFDPERYRAELDAFDLTEEQKLELLKTLWSIMQSFVELGFTVDLDTAVFDPSSIIPCDETLN